MRYTVKLAECQDGYPRAVSTDASLRTADDICLGEDAVDQHPADRTNIEVVLNQLSPDRFGFVVFDLHSIADSSSVHYVLGRFIAHHIVYNAGPPAFTV